MNPIAAMVLAIAILAPAPSRPSTAPPGRTTIKGVAVEHEAVRLTLVLKLTHAVSYRIAQPEPDRLRIDLERANFDLRQPIDLSTEDGWITDWSYGYLMLGYTRLSLRFDRQVTVVSDGMTPETAKSPVELTVDIAEGP